MTSQLHRGPGRPRKDPDAPAPVTRRVKLSPAVYDGLCRLSKRHGLTIHALLRLGAKRLVEADPDISGGLKNQT